MDNVRGDENDEFLLLFEAERAGKKFAQPGNVSQDRDLGIICGFLGLDQSTNDDC